MRSYTPKEELAVLAAELWRLREALIRTTSNVANAPDLVRALRVLVLDDSDALIPRLAKRYSVAHSVLTIPPARPPKSKRDQPEPGSLMLSGIVGVVNPDHFARWRTVRGIANPSKASGLTVSFQEYLDLGIAADASRASPISRKELLKDVANTSFGVHGSTAYPGHVETSWLATENGPHYLLIAQELAYEALAYGERILAVAVAKGFIDLATSRTPDGLGIPQPTCDRCGIQLGNTEFSCAKCGRELLQPFVQSESQNALSHALEIGLANETGHIALVVAMPNLCNPNAGAFRIAHASRGGRVGDLRRTAEMLLVWRVESGDVVHEAALDLKKRPLKLKPSDHFLLMLGWTPERAVVYIGSDPPDMAATSDGLPPFLDEAASSDMRAGA